MSKLWHVFPKIHDGYLRERALLIGAELTVAARPSGGTDVCLVVPGPAAGS